MPPDVVQAQQRLTRYRLADRFAMMFPQAHHCCLGAGVVSGNQQTTIIGERPCSGIEKLVYGGLHADSVFHGIRAAKCVPLNMASFTSEVRTAERCPETGYRTTMLICAQHLFSKSGVPGSHFPQDWRLLSNFPNVFIRPKSDGCNNVFMNGRWKVLLENCVN